MNLRREAVKTAVMIPVAILRCTLALVFLIVLAGLSFTAALGWCCPSQRSFCLPCSAMVHNKVAEEPQRLAPMLQSSRVTYDNLPRTRKGSGIVKFHVIFACSCEFATGGQADSPATVFDVQPRCLWGP